MLRVILDSGLSHNIVIARHLEIKTRVERSTRITLSGIVSTCVALRCTLRAIADTGS